MQKYMHVRYFGMIRSWYLAGAVLFMYSSEVFTSRRISKGHSSAYYSIRTFIHDLAK